MSETFQQPFYAPLTLSQILDRIFRLVRSNFRLLAGIAAVLPVSFFFATGLAFVAIFGPILPQISSKTIPAPDSLAQSHFIVFAVVLGLLMMVVSAIFFAAESHAAVRADLGIKVTFGEAYRTALLQSSRYLLLLLVVYLICFGPALLIELALFSSGNMMARHGTQASPVLLVLIPVATLLYLGAFVYGIILAMRYSLVFPACVMEGLPPMAAMRRSAQLTRGARGRIFLVLLILYAISYATLLIAGAVMGMLFVVSYLIGHGMHVDSSNPLFIAVVVILWLLVTAAMILWMAVTYASYAAAFAVIYNDQRFFVDRPTLPPGQPGAAA